MRLGSILALLLLFSFDAATAAEPTARDLEMERFLLDARVVEVHEMIPSTTYPMWLDLALDGRTGMALFKYKDKPREAPGGHEGAASETPNPHSYRYEVAAYRLDRLLGIGMVPVAVVREVNTDGALIEWIEDGATEATLRERGEPVRDPARLARQRAVMELFDSLIQNTARDEDDQLVVAATSQLYLIDHGRAFGTEVRLTRRFRSKPASLPRKLLKELEHLDAASVRQRMDGLLTDEEITALLARRDTILKKVAADRKQVGDAKVFQD